MFQLGAEAGAEICPATLWKTKLNFVTLTWNFIPRYRAENHYSNAVLRIRNKKKSDPDPQKRFKKILNKKKSAPLIHDFLNFLLKIFLTKWRSDLGSENMIRNNLIRYRYTGRYDRRTSSKHWFNGEYHRTRDVFEAHKIRTHSLQQHTGTVELNDGSISTTLCTRIRNFFQDPEVFASDPDQAKILNLCCEKFTTNNN